MLLQCCTAPDRGCQPAAAQVRYAAVRRQTAAHAGEREVQVLDYQNTAADLLPMLAASYALIFMVTFLSCPALGSAKSMWPHID